MRGRKTPVLPSFNKMFGVWSSLVAQPRRYQLCKSGNCAEMKMNVKFQPLCGITSFCSFTLILIGIKFFYICVQSDLFTFLFFFLGLQWISLLLVELFPLSILILLQYFVIWYFCILYWYLHILHFCRLLSFQATLISPISKALRDKWSTTSSELQNI